METQTFRGGLDNVVVAETAISRVDGDRGELILAGYSVDALAGKYGFEDICALLWTGSLPSAAERETLRQRLATGRELAYAALPRLGDALSCEDGMDALRAAVAQWRDPAALGGNHDHEAAAHLVGALAVFAAAWWRTAALGAAPIPPDPSLGHAADYWRMLRGEAPPAPVNDALDAYLVTVSDHDMNASTFAARVVTSTGSDMVSAVVAALGALKGPLHGGAPGPVLDMLDAIGSAEAADAWLAAELAAGRRIMGMGHRIYRVRDPRAQVLEQAAIRLAGSGYPSGRIELARAVEQSADKLLNARHPDRPLRANVEFFTAVLLDAIGIDRRMFSPTFAVARVAGWCGHIFEQRATGRLIRPKAHYIGPLHTA